MPEAVFHGVKLATLPPSMSLSKLATSETLEAIHGAPAVHGAPPLNGLSLKETLEVFHGAPAVFLSKHLSNQNAWY